MAGFLAAVGEHMLGKVETKIKSKTGITVGQDGVDKDGKTARSRKRTSDAKSEYSGLSGESSGNLGDT